MLFFLNPPSRGFSWIQQDWGKNSPQDKGRTLETEPETDVSKHRQQAKVIEEIRRLQQIHYLERRSF